MDLVTQTSLEALLLKATNSKNLNFDTAAVEAFCTLINKERDGAHIGVKVIAAKLPSGNEKEVLQTLNVLDTCMSKCGSHFQNEVGKFRFLNEMIKLVSPKYLGSQTPLTVKQKVLQLLYVWTLDYPKETKIKEAFDMLRKQGVIREIPNPNVPSYEPVNVPKRKLTSSVFQDEEKSKILQKLLQSKDPEDVQAANWLIKSMVKEDDKRAELKSKRISELESVQNNVRLLNEMLDSYKPGISSSAELDLIKELYQNCERLRPTINKLALETHHSEGMLGDVLETSDELSSAFNKYNLVILKGQTSSRHSSQDVLLNFDAVDINSANVACKVPTVKDGTENSKSSVDVLCDIFTASNIPDAGEVLQPISVLKCDKTSVCDDDKEKQNKFKALEELDVLGEHLLKENLQTARLSSFNKNCQDKIPMNLLSKISEAKHNQTATIKENESLSLDLNYLIKMKTENGDPSIKSDKSKSTQDSGDDFLVDISDEKMLEVEKTPDAESLNIPASTETKDKNETDVKTEKNRKCDIKLNDVCVKLENVKPSSFPPMKILDEKNGISVTLHLAKDKPKEGVNVYVITTVSRNELPLSNYLFQAVVPKTCKLKLQPPSVTDLPAFNPFLPPSAITQIMLIANPENVQISLRFIISYVMDDDTITEMGEVDSLPTV
ncbi:ADP-ribosylation factor-binding protein GGA1 [Anoplophora glabripennis]|nr:ADP-ribosylation factor-binding protein GGA1 [Anoplophora glabripennis]